MNRVPKSGLWTRRRFPLAILAVVAIILAAPWTAGASVPDDDSPLNPVALEVLSDGRLVVLDRFQGPLVLGAGESTYRPLLPDLKRYVPMGMAVLRGEDTDVLYVAMARPVGRELHVRVVAYRPSGEVVATWAFYGLQSLVGMTADFEQRRLLFVERSGRDVYALDLDRPGATPDRVTRIMEATQLSGAVAVGDHLLVADPSRSRLFATGPQGRAREVARGVGMPIALEAIPGTDQVLVLDVLQGRVLRVDGDSVRELAALDSWKAPVDLALDPDGRIWVADAWDGSLSLLSPDGAVLRQLPLRALQRR